MDDPNYPILQVAEYYRDGVILQRDQPIKVWGHANRGVEVTVRLDGDAKKVSPNELEQWSVTFPGRKASSVPITLEIKSSHGFERTVRDILIGDVWYLTSGSCSQANGLMIGEIRNRSPENIAACAEFRRRTAASSFPTPRKGSFETGGGKYRTYWSAADFSKESTGVTMFAYEFAKALGRDGVPQGFMTMSSGRGGRSRQLASPLSWTSFRGVKDVRNPVFNGRLNELFLQYPGTSVAKQAMSKHILDVKSFVAEIINGEEQGKDPSSFALQAPAFPEAGKGDEVPSDTIPTYAYNWNVSPLVPMGVAGVVWVPSESNIGENASEYATELEIYAKSLPETYEQGRVPFFYAHPTPPW